MSPFSAPTVCTRKHFQLCGIVTDTVESLETPSNSSVLWGRNYNPCIITMRNRSYVWRFIHQTYKTKEKLKPRSCVRLATV